MKRNGWRLHAAVAGLVLCLGATLALAQQAGLRREVILSDSTAFAPGEQDIRVEGQAPDAEMGSSVAFGDVNGDGIPDMIMGERGANRVYLYFGRVALDPNAVSSDPNRAYVVSPDLGTSNVDRPDAAIVCSSCNADPNAAFGFSVAAGDVDDDGRDEVVIGAPFDDIVVAGTDRGRAFIVRGRSSWPVFPAMLDVDSDADTFEIRGPSTSAADSHFLGFGVAVGDFDADGYDDVAVSSRNADFPLYAASPLLEAVGAVHVIRGSSSLSDVDLGADAGVRHILGMRERDFLGEQIVFCNVDEDPNASSRKQDLVTGAIGVDRTTSLLDVGAMYVFTGNLLTDPNFPTGVPAAPADYMRADPAISLGAGAGVIRVLGTDGEDALGFSVACADMTGDGFDDPAAGAFNAAGAGNNVSGGGEVLVFHGELTVPGIGFPANWDLRNIPADLRILPSTPGDQLGFSVAYGNFNCDSDPGTLRPLQDLLVSARRYDPQDPNTLVVAVNAGGSFVIRGAPVGVRPAGRAIDLALGTYDPSNPGVRPGNFPAARNDADSSATPCDPANPDDPANPCAVISVMLGGGSHQQTGFSATAGDFDDDGLCAEAVIGAVGDLTRLPGFSGRVHVVSMSDNENDGTSDLSDEDDDNDCLSDALETSGATDRLDPDSDDDGLQDGTESGVAAGVLRGEVIFAGSDCSTIDPNAPECCLDADGGSTTTDPLDPDFDGDNLYDGFGEDLDLNGAICGDDSLDGVIDPNEIICETDPNNPDTDGDGLDDDAETVGGCPNPIDADSDDDGLDDGNDEGGYGTDACLADTDGDGLQDGTEVGITAGVPGPNGQADSGPGEDGTDPTVQIPDADLGATTTDPADLDTDDDCLPDGCVGACSPLPLSPPILQGEDVNLNGQVDGAILTGGSGTGGSPAAGTETDPTLADSDLDQLHDGLEWGVDAAACTALGTDPTGNADADPASWTDARDSDTDDGGAQDGDEDTSAGGSLNGAWDFDPTAFVCDPGGDPLLDSDNETDPTTGHASDDRGAGFSRTPAPDFADPNNAVVSTYLQDDTLVVLLSDADENKDPNTAESITLDPANALYPGDPNSAGLLLGLTCFPDDPNAATTNTDRETLVLTETGPDTALFRGTLASSDGSGSNGDGTLNCGHAGKGRFAYRDGDDLCDQRIAVADVKLTQIRSVSPAQASPPITTPLGSVEAVFDQDLLCASTTTGTFSALGTSGPAGGTVTCDRDPSFTQFGNRRLTLTFGAPLPDDRYDISLDCDTVTPSDPLDPNDPAIADENGFLGDCDGPPCSPPASGDPVYCSGLLSGDGLPGGTFTYSITVDNDPSPAAAALDPNDGAILAVDPSSVTVAFSEAMDPNSIDSTTFTVGSQTTTVTCGSVTYDPNQRQATCTVSAPPTFPDDQYTVTLASDSDPNNPSVRDLAGNALDGNGDGTTGDDFTSTFVIDRDTAPAVTAHFPADGATETTAPTAVTVDFEEPMDPASITVATFTVVGLASPVDPNGVSVGVDPNNPHRARFEFAAGLPDDVYTVTLTGDADPNNPSVRDFGGNALDGESPCSGCVPPAISGNGTEGGDFVFSFTVDAAFPTVTGTTPACGLTSPGTPPSSVSEVTVVFSEAMDPSRFDPNTVRIEEQGDPNIVYSTDPNSVSYDPLQKTLTVVPDAILGIGSYQISVHGDVQATDAVDMNGNLLDGEVTATYPPSGDGTAGGTFTCLFDVDDPNVTMRISAIDPNDTATDPVVNEVYTSTNLLPEGVPGGTRRARIRSYLRVDPASVKDLSFFMTDSAGNKITCEVINITNFDPTGVNLKDRNIRCEDPDPPRQFPDDRYSVVAKGNLLVPSLQIWTKSTGKVLDGEFPCSGCIPPDISGDGADGGDFLYSFYFDNDQAPAVTAMAPAPGATTASGVSVTALEVTFDQHMDPATIDAGTFTLTGANVGAISGTISASWDPNSPTFTDPNSTTVTFTPASALADDDYTVMLTGDPNVPCVRDFSYPAGNALDGEFSGALPSGDGTAGGDFDPGFTVDTDRLPQVRAMTPAPSTAATSVVTAVTVTFDQLMDAATIDASTFTVEGAVGGAITADSVAFDPNTNTATFTYVNGGLGLPDDGYAVTLDADGVGTDVADLAGNALDGEYPCTGCVPPDISGEGTAGGSFVATFVVDTTPPTAVAMAPAPASTETSAVTAVTVTFDEEMDASTIDASTFTVVGAVAGAITPDSVAFDPNTNASTFTYVNGGAGLPDDGYTVTLDADGIGMDVADLAGHALDGEFGVAFPSGDGTAGGSFVATFTVDADQIPTATAMTPAPLGTETSAVTAVTVTFDQLMDAATIDASTFTVLGAVAGAITPDSVAFDAGTNTATFTYVNGGAGLPDDDYTVTLDADGAGTDVSDLAGHALDGEYPCTGCVPPSISGDGVAGGSFVATFTVDADQIPTATAMTPAPASTEMSAVTAVTVTFDQLMDAATIDASTFTVVGAVAGAITPDSVAFDAGTNTATFTYVNGGAGLPDDDYTVTLDADGAGTDVSDLAGHALDGEYPCTGCVPPSISGDGVAGGSFVATFTVDAIPIPPPALPVDISLDVDAFGVLVWESVPVAPGETYGASVYNLYRGDMGTLVGGGSYTQDPSLSSEALVACGIVGSAYDDGHAPAAGKVAFYLLAIVEDGVEVTLGTDSSGLERPSDGLCDADGTLIGTRTDGTGGSAGKADVTLKPADGE